MYDFSSTDLQRWTASTGLFVANSDIICYIEH